MSAKIELSLTEEEREVLVLSLKSVLSDLSYEIADTDSHDFKEGLKTRRRLLESVVEHLQKT